MVVGVTCLFEATICLFAKQGRQGIGSGDGCWYLDSPYILFVYCLLR
uniref:Uncharacterized protein n=1 Tax=Arundo donax TaxID=35708 RepID=A0A0A8YTM6_ARUDO